MSHSPFLDGRDESDSDTFNRFYFECTREECDSEVESVLVSAVAH